MTNKVDNYPKPKDTLRARYLPQQGFFQLFFEVDGKTKIVEPIYLPDFDCDGKYMRNIIRTVAKKLKCYDISSEDIIFCIFEACKSCNMKLPKIMPD